MGAVLSPPRKFSSEGAGSNAPRKVNADPDALYGPSPIVSAQPTRSLERGSLRTPSRTVPGDLYRIWSTGSPVVAQGGALRTWSFANPNIDRVHLAMRTGGCPLSVRVEFWQGPDSTPQIIDVFNEDGNICPFNAVICTPGEQKTLAIRNTGGMESPLNAFLEGDIGDLGTRGSADLRSETERILHMGIPQIVQGGAVYSKIIDPFIDRLQVLLKTDGSPLSARVELMEGSRSLKQAIDVYSNDGRDCPFFAVFESPGAGTEFRIVNDSDGDSSLLVSVEPYELNNMGRSMSTSFW
uniref:Uncharacterized protein n=1 Tax=Trieres chinensis TaxID=1514140 RepID=A0A7S2A8W8_TRICV|mmetsp:Transcript_7674/g.16300  ORF Transcript_7674/g.16300 Transcript_7674/m.16300 type:complete len:296 (+) Transcript_7674:1-888(+)